MQGKICLVTGATSGIGLVTARELARMGARVIIAGRNADRAERTKTAIERDVPGAQLDVMLADFARLADVRKLAEAVAARYDRLDVLVNNAGLVVPRRSLSADSYEMTFAVNHLAGFLLTNLLLDQLKASDSARVVNVSSSAHYMGRLDFANLQRERFYTDVGAYAQSKLANVLFTYGLARRLAGTSVTSNVLHPGVVYTNFAAGSLTPFGIMLQLGRPFEISPEQGARTSVYVASSSKVAGVTATYYDNRKPRRSSGVSYNDAVQERLWHESVRLVGLD